MKLDIPYYIRQVLREQRSVYVPEIGTFTLSQAHAIISKDKHEIEAPKLDLIYNDTRSDDNRLALYIQDSGKYSTKKINQAISEYTQSTFNKLINVNKSEITGVGTLKKEAYEDTVTFEPSISTLTREYKDLASLSIKPIERIKEKNEVNHVVDTNDVTTSVTGRFSWLQPIVAGILIAAIAILLVKTCMNSESSTYHNPDDATIGLNGDTEDETRSESVLSQKLDRQYSEVDSILTDATNSNTHAEKIVDKQNNKEEKIIVAPKTVKNEDVSAKGITNSGSKKTSGKYKDLIPESGGCIIILGSFKRASNVSKMVSLVEQDGKEVYTSQYKGKTRVGFKFDCSNGDLDGYLVDVRDRLSSKAWYLDPILSIPYK